jgi:hypothetical protein
LGPNPWPRDVAAADLLGHRYLAAAGWGEMVKGERDHGTKIYTDAETFPNATTSSVDPLRQRRVPTNAPYFRELYAIAKTFNTPLPMHMQWHTESVAQLEDLLASDRQGVVVLSHCGKDTVAKDIRPLLEKHPNLFCDLGFRSTHSLKKKASGGPIASSFGATASFAKRVSNPTGNNSSKTTQTGSWPPSMTCTAGRSTPEWSRPSAWVCWRHSPPTPQKKWPTATRFESSV